MFDQDAFLVIGMDMVAAATAEKMEMEERKAEAQQKVQAAQSRARR